MLKTISGTGSDVFEIEEVSKGITFKNIRKDSTIKVDLVSTNGEDRNVFPQLTLAQYADLFTSLLPREQVNQSDGTAYKSIYIPFSLVGALPFTEDYKLKISLGNLNNRTIEVHNNDDMYLADFSRLIQVDRHDIKASRSEMKVSVSPYAFAFFPNEEPTKIEMYDQGRKVTFGAEQIARFNLENRITEQIENPADTFAYVLGTENIAFPVLNAREVTIHKDTKEMIMYLVSA